MRLTLPHIVRRSLAFNKPGVFYLMVVIALLTAVITGSLMTGSSVRNSLRKTSLEKLGNAGVLVSSTTRYFDPSLTKRFGIRTGEKCTGILEINGYCNNLSTGQSSPEIKIFAVDSDFFPFQGSEGIIVRQGEAAVNEKLADFLRLQEGDELAIHFNSINDLPADAPFAPGRNASESLVLKATIIRDNPNSGNFSLGISQIIPMNVFVNRMDISTLTGKTPGINRLIVSKDSRMSESDIYSVLKEILKPEDIGIQIRPVPATKGMELISNRVFIDPLTVGEIKNLFPVADPVITYMINDFRTGNKSSPYSFIAALPPSLYDDLPEDNGIVINRWLADDVSVNKEDTVVLTWYSPDPLNHLSENKGTFIVKRIVGINGIWADSLLMPEFPGIAGKESCTEWDAGIEIDMGRIRDKDEEYWNRYRGLPKAFISYETGKQLWGNNFGPATSIRFPGDVSEQKIRDKLKGALDPYKSGFSIVNLPGESIKAANKSVDFSTLFLSLGFFMILSAVILLALVIGMYYESKRIHLTTFISLGFSDMWIRKYMFLEAAVISVTGALVGAVFGWLFNLLIIKALNSVWRGTVQTDTIIPFFKSGIVLTGFIVSEIIILVILMISTHSFLKRIKNPEQRRVSVPSPGKNLKWMLTSTALTAVILICAMIFREHVTILSFSGGVIVFVTLVLLTRQYCLGRLVKGFSEIRRINNVSRKYYSVYSSQAITPVIFIAAGLFAVVITGVNRLNLNETMLKPSGGTGGYLLWGESAIPVTEDLNSNKGRNEFGLDETDLKNLTFIQAFKSAGNDASCLNLNHITAPPLLGLDPSEFIRRGSFSFASGIKNQRVKNTWEYLDIKPVDNTIFGIADQTVLQYGLMIKPGDTLIIRSESGQKLNIVIAAGLRSSVFQGYVLIGSENFKRYFPSVSGKQLFLADGDKSLSEIYRITLNERMANFGIHFTPAGERLASFFIVTNTYLSVFSILGSIGLILGVIGLGFILLRNFNQRKHEFGLMMATGFSLRQIREMIFREQSGILLSGVITGLISSVIATIPSAYGGSGVPWISILTMIILVIAAGMTALFISLRAVRSESLTASIRKD
jgi:ABC-type antimicrobial peptide transport system permease subunit